MQVFPVMLEKECRNERRRTDRGVDWRGLASIGPMKTTRFGSTTWGQAARIITRSRTAQNRCRNGCANCVSLPTAHVGSAPGPNCTISSSARGGKDHHAAVRALAYKWIRIMFRCWKDRTPYDDSLYVKSLTKRGSLLANGLNLPRPDVVEI
jgi:hypothetical protein